MDKIFKNIQNIKNYYEKKNLFQVVYGIESENTFILFADMCDFTKIVDKFSKRNKYKEIINLLNEFFTRLGPLVYKNYGVIDKYIGDCIMGLFGGLFGEEKGTNYFRNLRNALNCACEMLCEIDKLNSISRIQFGLSIGLWSGNVFLGMIEELENRDNISNLSAIGDAVNIASRMQYEANRNEIIVPYVLGKKYSDFLNSIIGKYELEKIYDQIHVKGKKETLRIYRIGYPNKVKSKFLDAMKMD